jgi:hypothetical protein
MSFIVPPRWSSALNAFANDIERGWFKDAPKPSTIGNRGAPHCKNLKKIAGPGWRKSNLLEALAGPGGPCPVHHVPRAALGDTTPVTHTCCRFESVQITNPGGNGEIEAVHRLDHPRLYRTRFFGRKATLSGLSHSRR